MEDDGEEIRIKYLDVYPELPIDAPIGCPHIIDVNSMNEDICELQNMTIADAVVTILYKFMPAALTTFLDLERPYFHYIQAGCPGSLDFCIKRDGRTVGFLNEKEHGGWDDQHKYSIDGMATEKWTPSSFRVSGMHGTTSKKKMLEEASGHVFTMLWQEPWLTDLPAQPVELACGLSRGREF